MEADDLAEEIHRCTKCAEFKGKKRVVLSGKKIPSDFGESPQKVKIMFVAESPSPKGVYFYNLQTNSNLRNKLFDLLSEVGLMEKKNMEEFRRRGYYIVDAARCPFANANGHNATPPSRANENCRPFLMQEILMRKPDIICPLGRSSLKPFISYRKFKISDYVGKILETGDLRDDIGFPNVPIYPLWFPAAMIRWDR